MLGRCRKKIYRGSYVEYLVLVRLALEITLVGILNFPRYIFSGGGRETSVFNDLHKLEGTNILSLDSFRGSLPLISQPRLTGATKTWFLTAFLKLAACSNFSRSLNLERDSYYSPSSYVGQWRSLFCSG